MENDFEQKTVNERVAFFRKAKNFSQTVMAERLGIKTSSYSQMERKGSITCERLIKIAQILQVDAYVLLYGKQHPSAEKSKKEIKHEIKRKVTEEVRATLPEGSKYLFLENISNTELKYIKAIYYLKKQERFAVYEYALNLRKSKKSTWAQAPK